VPSSTPVLFVSFVEYPYNNSGFVFYTTPVAYLMLVMCLYYLSHPEIFEFQDVIKIKNKTTILIGNVF